MVVKTEKKSDEEITNIFDKDQSLNEESLSNPSRLLSPNLSLINESGLLCSSSVMGKRWKLRNINDRDVDELSQVLKGKLTEGTFFDLYRFSDPGNVSIEIDTISRILSARGVNVNNIEDFISPTIKHLLPNPSDILDMDKAVDVLYKTIIENKNNGKKIAILGDYDVDGATSSSLLYLFLQRACNIEAIVHIPDRIDEGYGPNKQVLQQFKDNKVDTVITLDCGTTSFEEIAYANEIGLKVIVIDHHISEVTLPKAEAIINPNRIDEQLDADNDCKKLAAVGVTFLFCVALNRKLRSEGFYKENNISPPNLLSFLDIVALGTVCDMMQLVGLNRGLVAQGLRVINNKSNIGLKALSQVAGMSDENIIEAYHLGFIFGPRINAGGRVGKSRLGFELLTTNDYNRAIKIAKELDEFNNQRKLIEEQVLQDALIKAEPQVRNGDSTIVVSGEDWHQGVIGIVAGRLKDRFSKPAVVISINEGGSDVGKASARSISGFDIGRCIHNATSRGILIGGGGHSMAAGFSIEKNMIPKFKNYLEECTLNLDITPCTKVDAVISQNAATVALVETIDHFSPYGIGNPNPKFVISNVEISYAAIVGGSHVKVLFNDSKIEGICFRCVGSQLGEVLLNTPNRPINILGSIGLNVWKGKVSVQVIIEDLELV